jgi:hypothetical protein
VNASLLATAVVAFLRTTLDDLIILTALYLRRHTRETDASPATRSPSTYGPRGAATDPDPDREFSLGAACEADDGPKAGNVGLRVSTSAGAEITERVTDRWRGHDR